MKVTRVNRKFIEQAQASQQPAKSNRGELTLTLPYAPTVNTYWRHVVQRYGKKVVSKVLISAKGRAYKQKVFDLIKPMGLVPFTEPLDVVYECYRPDLRVRDLDNLAKSLGDSLKYANVYADDSQIVDLHLKWAGMVKGGKIVVHIKPHEAN